MAAVVIITNNVAIPERLKLNRSVPEKISETRAVHHPLASEVLNQRVAGSVTDDWQMIIQGAKRRIGGSTRNVLLIVVAEQVNRQQELTLGIFATHSPGTFF